MPVKTLAQVEREHIEFVLKNTSTLQEAANVLGINIATLYRKRVLLKLPLFKQQSGQWWDGKDPWYWKKQSKVGGDTRWFQKARRLLQGRQP